MNHTSSISSLGAYAILAMATSGTLAQDATTTFDAGTEGWVGGHGTFVDTDTSGNRFLRSIDETFGVHYTNNTHTGFLGDYTASETITISVDVRVDKIDTDNIPDGRSSQQTRSLVLNLRNSSFGSGGIFPYGAVIFVLDNQINQTNNAQWQTFSTTFDPNSVELPAGWIGFGGSDDADGPVLPEGATFADILTNVDEISLSTFVPGEFYLQIFFDFSVDNFSITRNAPSCQADLNDDGSLNFFDVSAFLNAFSASDPVADFTGDGLFNFFDVSAFLNAFSAGCP
tara:strand:- start:345218 stop:346072 length:855 start_codon:yes stop_codon:yes gene_type:complete